MQLFYNPDINEVTEQFSFNKEESKHITKVLRKKEGDILNITNGNGWLFKVEISVANIKNCLATIIEKYEWFLEKATEIGIDSITPIICDHSERKIIKHERLEKIIQSAMKQSLNCYLPKLHNAIKFSDYFKQDFTGQLFIAHCEETDRKSLKAELQTNADITILIGPEGDFSIKEIQTAIQNKFIPVSLGTTRLRTETAAIVACHSVAFKNE